jgi:RimJ/RimL family protein N-acetyltransferase
MPAMTDTEMLAPRPMLRGELVWLRPTEPSDIIDDVPYAGDVEIGHFGGGKTPWSRASAERFATEFMGQIGETNYPYTICLLGEQRGIGAVFLRSVDKVNGSAMVGIFISDRRYLGKG